MFEQFKYDFKEYLSISNPLVNIKEAPFKYAELLFECGGKSYDRGLYTVHSFEESLKWTKLLSRYFPKYSNNEIISFGHDWMGRQFCVSIKTKECINIFDPATQEEFHIETDLIDFHENILPTNRVEILVSDLFDCALTSFNLDGLGYDQCVGFKTPLFLGGKEEVSNYDVGPLEVYWDFEFQLFNQIKHLPDGTLVNKVAINPFSKE